MPSCTATVTGDHKKAFDEAVKKLTAIRKQIEKAETLAEISKLETEVRNALMETIHRANFLSYWMKEAADKRRQEIRKGE
jgi:predicted translin family RNA/ssDNA-binding protein